MYIFEEPPKKRGRRICLILFVLFLLFAVVPMSATVFLYNQNFGSRSEIPAFSALLRYEDVEGYPRRLTSFYSGHNRLQAYIYGEENHKGLVVIAHGIGGGAESYFPEIMYFVDMGWRVFAFDKTGSHNSEGAGKRGLPQGLIDLNAALNYIALQGWNLPIMLFGHSWGGYAVTAVLNKDHNISAVVSLAGFDSPLGVMSETARAYVGMNFAEIVARPYLRLYNWFVFGRYANLSAVDGINSGTVPVMIVHGTEDESIFYNGASIIAQRNRITNPNAVFVSRSLPHNNGHNNLLRDAETAAFIDQINLEWRVIWESYGRNPPDQVRADFYAGIRERISALDREFMGEINRFFQRAL